MAFDPTTYRFPSRRYNDEGVHIGPGEWLNLIRQANGVFDGIFGSPDSTGDWWAGGYVEEYEHARVIHDTDPIPEDEQTVRIVAKTAEGERILAEASSRLINQKAQAGAADVDPSVQELGALVEANAEAEQAQAINDPLYDLLVADGPAPAIPTEPLAQAEYTDALEAIVRHFAEVAVDRAIDRFPNDAAAALRYLSALLAVAAEEV